MLIPAHFAFEAGGLRSALHATFVARAIQPLPSALPPPPPDEWRPGYRRMAAEVGFDPELSAGCERARAFLDPVLGGTIPDGARWDPTRRTVVGVGWSSDSLRRTLSLRALGRSQERRAGARPE